MELRTSLTEADQGPGEGSCRLAFTLPVTPRAQMRPRFARTGRAYKHKSQVMAEETILSLMAQHQPAQPFTGPVMLGVRCFMPIPKSKPKKFKAAALAGTGKFYDDGSGPRWEVEIQEMCK